MCAQHGSVQARRCREQGPHGDTPTALQSPGWLPWEEGPAGQPSFLLEMEEGPREPSIFLELALESRPPHKVCRRLKGTLRCQCRHNLPGKREFPWKGNFSLDGKGAAQGLLAMGGWSSQDRAVTSTVSARDHGPDPATTQDHWALSTHAGARVHWGRPTATDFPEGEVDAVTDPVFPMLCGHPRRSNAGWGSGEGGQGHITSHLQPRGGGTARAPTGGGTTRSRPKSHRPPSGSTATHKNNS